MSYLLYKLKFPNGIHIGTENSKLEETSLTIPSDTFFSAIYNEYMKIYGDEELLKIVEKGEFKISDLFPYKETEKETNFYLPKPYVNNIKRKQNSENEEKIDRKKVKKLSYIPASQLKSYFDFLENGKNFPDIDEDFGEKELYTKNKISRIDEDTELYNIEVFKFRNDSGLFFIVEILEEWKNKFDNILESLSLTGIGGKKSSGYGYFEIIKLDEKDYRDDLLYLNMGLKKKEKNYILLSSYLPKKEEIEKIKNIENGYQLIKRSGFVNNFLYSKNPQKRKQVYMIASGSVLNFKPEGRLANLKLNGNHNIFRMGKPIVIGVDLWEK